MLLVARPWTDPEIAREKRRRLKWPRLPRVLRFTRGEIGAAAALAVSIALWIVVPAVLAARRLGRMDL